jgi:hypothetical protein
MNLIEHVYNYNVICLVFGDKTNDIIDFHLKTSTTEDFVMIQ